MRKWASGSPVSVGVLLVVAGFIAMFLAWNGAGPWPGRFLALQPWHSQVLEWRAQLLGQQDLCSALLRFVAERR